MDFPFTIMELQVAEQKHQHFRKCTLSKESKSTSGAISSDSLSFSGLVLPEKNVVSIILKFQFHTNELFISLEETYSNLIYLKGFRQNSILVISVICSMIPSAFKLIKILIKSAFTLSSRIPTSPLQPVSQTTTSIYKHNQSLRLRSSISDNNLIIIS